jgi:6-phosphogluconolactonase
MSTFRLYLGTYTKTGPSRGIYAATLDAATGALSRPELVAPAVDPAWVTLTPGGRFLYTLHGSAAQARGFDVDPATGRLAPLPDSPLAATPANPPSHLAVDATGRVLLAANYRDGFVAALAIRPDGTLGAPQIIRHEGSGPDPKRQEKPHVHSVTVSPDNRFVAVADLGLDRVYVYALDPATATLAPAAVPFASVPPGAGPRHFKFHPSGCHAYVINEMGGSITAFDYDADRGALVPVQTVPTLPADFTGLKWNAEIRVHPNGRFLYGSNRTHDSLAVFAIAADTGLLSLVEIVPTGGQNPRNFALSPDGRWLVCGHQDSPLLTVFAVDAATGRLTATPHTAPVAACVCIHFVE